MKRNLFALCMAAMLLAAGCGAENSSAGTSPSIGASSGGTVTGGDYWNMGMSGGTESFSPEDPGAPAESESQSGAIYQNPGAKLIRRAELTIQTERFDESEEALNRLTEECGGYFESAHVYGGGRRDVSASRWGEYIVRVPAQQYDQFLSATGDLGYVTSKNETSEDIGERYYDTEARLKTQRTKQERLLALLERAETMEDIISLENALSEVEYQIEQYTSELNRYDALVGFATFTISLSEVGRVTQEVGETASLGERMAAGFQSSLRGLSQGVQDFLIWASYHIFLLAALAAAAAVAAVAVRRKATRLRETRLREENRKKSGEE